MHVEVNIDQICVFQRPQDLTSKVPGSENHRHGHRDVTVATAAASHGGARRRRGQCDSDSDQFKLGVPRAGQPVSLALATVRPTAAAIARAWRPGGDGLGLQLAL